MPGRERLEEALRQTQTRLLLIHRISTGIASGMSVRSVIEHAVHEIARLFGGLRVAYSTLDERSQLTIVHSTQPKDMPDLTGLEVDLTGVPDYLRDLQAFRPVVVEDVLTDARVAPLAQTLTATSARAILDVPLQHADKPAGVLFFDSALPRKWSGHEIESLSDVAKLLSVAIANAHVEQQRRQAEEQTEAQRDFALQVLGAMGQGLMVSRASAGADGHIEYINPAGARILGYTPDEVLGKSAWCFVVPEDLPYLKEARAQRQAGISSTYEARLRRRDGSIVHALISGAPRLREGTLIGSIVVFTDLTERKKAEEALAASRAESQALLDAIPDLMCRLNRDGTVVGYKGERETDVGVPPEVALGRTIYELFPDLAPQVMRAVDRALRTGKTQALEYQVLIRGSLRDREGRVVATSKNEAVLIVRDITEQRSAERMKDFFVSMVSHELRTPLTAVRGALGLLSDGVLDELPDKGRQMLDIATANTERLIRLTNDILEVQRIRLGKFEIEKGLCNAADLMVQAVDAVRPLAAKGGVKVEYATPDVHMSADSDRIVQVLTNLLSNAIGHSPLGTTIHLMAEGRADRAVFQVKDQGPGIPVYELEHIFDAFRQVEAPDLRGKGGIGLGLFICRSIIDAHGGRIWAESAPGEGSTFSFSLPLSGEPSPAATGWLSDGLP